MFSLVAIALLCLLGPGLSLRYEFQASFLMVWPAIYANAIGLLLFLWINMRGLKLHNRDLAISAFEYLICPILAINIWKKLARHEKEMPNATELQPISQVRRPKFSNALVLISTREANPNLR